MSELAMPRVTRAECSVCRWYVDIPIPHQFGTENLGEFEQRRIHEWINKHLREEHGLVSVLVAEHEKQQAEAAAQRQGYQNGLRALTESVKQAVREVMAEQQRAGDEPEDDWL